MTPEAARLSRIRARLDAIAPGEWSRVHDAEGCFVEVRGAVGELFPLARFHAGADEDEISFVVEAPDNVRFLLGLVERAARAVRELRGGQGQDAEQPARGSVGKDFAAECAMKCAEPAFRVFLEERHGLERPLTDERVAQKVRGLLGVVSRAELNNGGQATEAWKALRGEFENWRRTGR